jgi:uncharacterized membrane protein
MRGRRLLRIVGLIVLAVVGLLIYADLRSVHQIFRVTDKMINNASNSQVRQALIEVALAVDVALFLWISAGVLGWPRRTIDA